MLRLHDTGTGTVRPFEPRTPGEVSMYVCGPTVYDLPHIGHGRFTLTFDVLRRYLLVGSPATSTTGSPSGSSASPTTAPPRRTQSAATADTAVTWRDGSSTGHAS
ncbi:MAG: cysteinyl-tRNA synthetase [Trebonia sp.]|nr:cysteinyl-tRNA synthetase [Trebonia sp.]